MSEPKPKSKSKYFRFFRGEVWPRKRQVFLHRNFLMALLVAFLSGLAAIYLPKNGAIPATTFRDLCTATLAFGALSFAGSLTGATVAVNLPPDRVVAAMVLNDVHLGARFKVEKTPSGFKINPTDGGDLPTKDNYKPPFHSLYSDLVFTFLVTSAAQIIMAVTSLVVFALIGGMSISPNPYNRAAVIGLAAVSGTSAYAIFQLLSSMKALSSLAARRESFFRAELMSSSDNKAESQLPEKESTVDANQG